MLRRRAFLAGTLALLLWPRAGRAAALPEATRRALAASPYVYVSPLLRGGSESTCHGEVWYGWLDGRVVLTTPRTTWKARSLVRGLDRARIWVGDYGRWKRPVGRNEAFRQGPSFTARAIALRDDALFERLMQTLAVKYPDGFPDWRDRMRAGYGSGQRLLIAYAPLV